MVLHDGAPLNWQGLLSYLYDAGIAREPRFYTQQTATDLPKIRSVSIPSRLSTRDGSKQRFNGFGIAETFDEAISKAVGELLERHFLAEPASGTLHTRSLAAADKRYLDISRLNNYLPWQVDALPALRRNAGASLQWVAAREYCRGVSIHVPAQLVFWSHARAVGEPILANATTSGAAGHFTREEAILAALLENIQRDGFLIYWLNAITPNRLDLDTVDDDRVRSLVEYLKRYDIEIHCMDVTTDVGIPTLICATIDRSTAGPAIAIGGAAGFDIAELILQGAQEALSILTSLTQSEPRTLNDSYEPFVTQGVKRKDRLHFWRGPEKIRQFEFFVTGPKIPAKACMRGLDAVQTIPERIARVQALLAELGTGYEIYIYEARDPVLTKLGYHVVKAIVPQLMPMYLIENLATLDAPRLRLVPGKLGYRATDTYNPLPHPFP